MTRPENEGRWNTTFSRTYFYAEGKSEVVVVRDNPMTFRIQRGTNDPTNLIRGQLQIARSVTDAAISIASAASGLPVGGLTSFQPSGDDSEGEGTIAPGDPELQKRAKTFAEQRASAEAEARFRRAALRSLDVNLRNVQQRLLESAAGSPEESAALDQLRSVLLGSKPKFPDS